MLSVSYRDTDNTDHTDKTITHAGAGLDSEPASDSASRSEQAPESDCRLELERGLEPDSAPGLGLAPASEPATDSGRVSESDSVFDSVPASAASEQSLVQELWPDLLLRLLLPRVGVVVNDEFLRRCAPA